ncbi:hypothetical protein L210DRAFT_3561634 [Boletus edulis BED1]|uniref:Uncharacterized protein n=1 Tax=Boletus edulis BED1 TaxID=1328754 RepID=A0AAD4BAS6_BOLED|nr:hypothetical protein L210DRAFT_3583368 [Boletus edulis BED1]KAF8430773.1 hypothetical protein L210DRAFT_3561634 [Boletus edulis BED1]
MRLALFHDRNKVICGTSALRIGCWNVSERWPCGSFSGLGIRGEHRQKAARGFFMS